MTPVDVVKQVKDLTGELISSGLAIDQNFPAIRGDDQTKTIGFLGDDKLSSTLRNVRYFEAYQELRTQRSYNILLLDGGILQFLYLFELGALSKHRLAFFPSPDLIEFQNNSELYETDDVYTDMLSKGVVTTPLRFDFDRTSFVEVDHPMSHLTIGQYKNCRIPVSGPLSPAFFAKFIMRSFYNVGFKKFLENFDFGNGYFDFTITDAERAHGHFAYVP